MTDPVKWKAPHELLMYGPELGGPAGVSIRYLNSSLVCGMCAHRYSLSADVWNCKKNFGSGFVYKKKACMAFKDKK